jgi:hypothetical protein
VRGALRDLAVELASLLVRTELPITEVSYYPRFSIGQSEDEHVFSISHKESASSS